MLFSFINTIHMLCVSSTNTVVPILKRNFVGLCRCLPKDYMVTLERMKHKASISDGVALELAQLPTAEERNGMIIAMMLGPLDSDVEVLGFCDLLEDAVDSDSSMKFIHNLRAGMDTSYCIVFKWSYLFGADTFKLFSTRDLISMGIHYHQK